MAAAWRDWPWRVADGSTGLAGVATSTPWKGREAYRWTVEVGVYVAAGERGRGLGTALLDSLVDSLASRGIRTLVAGIAQPNPASVSLFEGRGFRPAGVLPAVGFKAGAWRDVGYWTLRLGGEGPPE